MESREASTAEAQDEEILTHKTLVYRACQVGSWLLCKLYNRCRVEGIENLPMRGGAVIASNHQSHLDILFFGAIMPRHTCFVARDTLADWRWLAWVMRGCGAVLVKRGASDRRALRAMAEHLERGDILAIFPEGTRTIDGSLREFKGGALLAARLAQVPIVPVGIRGSVEAWPRSRAFPLPKKIAMRFGKPIDSSLPDAQERLIAAIQSMIGDGTYRSVVPVETGPRQASSPTLPRGP